MDELCDLSLVLHSFEDHYESVYELIEPYILNKLNNMTEINIVQALAGFYNPHLSKRFHILDVLEATLISQIDQISHMTVRDLVKFYTERRMGSRILIETLKNKAENSRDPENQRLR